MHFEAYGIRAEMRRKPHAIFFILTLRNIDLEANLMLKRKKGILTSYNSLNKYWW